MNRRDFVQKLGLGLAGAWAVGRVAWPLPALAGVPELHLACLADAHLLDGDSRRPEAQALARAVAELRRLKPAPDLVLFAGDLAHSGDPAALALGQEILADLPAPLFMVLGEGDGPAGWQRGLAPPFRGAVVFPGACRARKCFGSTPPGAPAPAARSSGWATPAAAGWPGSWRAWTPKPP